MKFPALNAPTSVGAATSVSTSLRPFRSFRTHLACVALGLALGCTGAAANAEERRAVAPCEHPFKRQHRIVEGTVTLTYLTAECSPGMAQLPLEARDAPATPPAPVLLVNRGVSRN